MSALLLIALLLLLAHSHDKRRQLARTVSELDAQLTASEVERLKLRESERKFQRAHFKVCDCHDSWDQCPCADGGHPADGSCGCCPLGTGICGPRRTAA